MRGRVGLKAPWHSSHAWAGSSPVAWASLTRHLCMSTSWASRLSPTRNFTADARNSSAGMSGQCS
eukprot:1277170-Lingulodinium_polyedra.AAC.1